MAGHYASEYDDPVTVEAATTSAAGLGLLTAERGVAVLVLASLGVLVLVRKGWSPFVVRP